MKNLDGFIYFFNSKINRFTDFKINQIEFDHLVYSKCATLSVASCSLEQLVKSNYPEIFDTGDDADINEII